MIKDDWFIVLYALAIFIVIIGAFFMHTTLEARANARRGRQPPVKSKPRPHRAA